MKLHQKLIRDRIPEIIAAAGERSVTRILDEAEYREALEAKLGEEASELREAPLDKKPEEIADVYEVVDAIIAAHGFSKEEILRLQSEKREKRGGFLKRLFLERTE